MRPTMILKRVGWKEVKRVIVRLVMMKKVIRNSLVKMNTNGER